ncbi:DpnD/PcfM family protein [Psychrobacter sp. DWR1-2-3]|uniref:DpnD/PcfM family protein n=1 Tax=Psychrobacter sp. DWR1-2-3 TaxID=2804637 RepID=UPI003CEF4618
MVIKSDKTVEKVFQIEIVETLSNLVEISAENEQEALLKAQELYRNEEVVLYPDDLIDTKFNIFKYD